MNYSFPVTFLVYGFLVGFSVFMIFYVFITKFFYIFIKLFLKLNNIISSAVMHVRILNEFSDSST